jgi:NitT/TauT family transport system substrate-binding protein
VAVAEGYFGEENIEIEDFVLGSSTPLRNAVIAGEYDFGLFSFVHVPLARQANSPWRMVATTHDHELFSLIVRNELQSQLKQVADLRGKRVGYSMPGSGSWAAAVTYLSKAGLDPSTDVELVSLGGDANVLYTALQSGKVDALASWEPSTSRAMTSNVAYPLVKIWDADAQREWLGADTLLAEGLVTREDVIQNKPDLVRRMVSAHLKGLAFIRQNSAEMIADALLANSLPSRSSPIRPGPAPAPEGETGTFRER